MLRSCSKAVLLLSLTAALAKSAEAYLLELTLSPNTYTVTQGGQFTVSGFFRTADLLSFAYTDDRLFGLSPTSPHLGIVAGSVLSSHDFNPPVGGTSFADEFGGCGYLGPSITHGPTVTSLSLLRTFVMPASTPLGVYAYSYGVDLFPDPLQPGTILYDTSLRVTVVPEPAAAFLLGGVIVLLWWGCDLRSPYSQRSALAGSTRPARRAGT